MDRLQAMLVRVVDPAARWGSLFRSLVLLATPFVGAWAQAAIIRGRVVDEMQRPLDGARVQVVGMAAMAIADTGGSFRLTAVPPGTRIIRASMIGHAFAEVARAVGPGDTVVVNFRLRRDVAGRDSLRFRVSARTLDSTRLRRVAPARTVRRERQVTVAMRRPRVGSAMPLVLFDSLDLNMLVRRVTGQGQDFAVEADVITPTGSEQGMATMISRGNHVAGNVRVGSTLILIRPQEDSIHSITEVDLREQAGSKPDHEPPPTPAPPDDDASVRRETGPGVGLSRPPWLVPLEADQPTLMRRTLVSAEFDSCVDQRDASVGRVPEIRILAGYTQPAAAVGIADEVAIAVRETASILRESGVRVDLELVGVVPVASSETAGGVPLTMNDLLGDLIAAPAGSPVLPLLAERERLAADVVVLVTANSLARGLAHVMRYPHASFADSAFIIVDAEGMRLGLSLAHEIGHILGGEHQGSGPSLGVGAAYAAPFRCVDCSGAPGVSTKRPDGAGWITVMGLPRDFLTDIARGVAYDEIRIPRFSNPEVDFNGSAAGTAIGTAGAADHRSLFLASATAVAAFRSTPAVFVSNSASAPWSERLVTPEWQGAYALAQLDAGRRADAFRVDEVTGEWFWAKDLREPWTRLNGPDATRAVKLADLRFGDFNGDGIDDVFWVDAVAKRWMVSYGGRSTATVLNTLAASLGRVSSDLVLGRFTAGSAKSDVFWADPTTGTWWISVAGAADWTKLADAAVGRKVPRSELRFGDFDGDGRVEPFHATAGGGTTRWRAHDYATGDWRPLQPPRADLPADASRIVVGQFDHDRGADVLVFTEEGWSVSARGAGPLAPHFRSCESVARLRFADVDGDGVLDAIRSGLRP